MDEVQRRISIEMRDMPNDFGLPLDEEDGVCTLYRFAVIDGRKFAVTLGFQMTGSATEDETSRLGLRTAVWQALELARLGHPELAGVEEIQ